MTGPRAYAPVSAPGERTHACQAKTKTALEYLKLSAYHILGHGTAAAAALEIARVSGRSGPRPPGSTDRGEVVLSVTLASPILGGSALPADFLESLRARYTERGDEVKRSTVVRCVDILRRWSLATLCLVLIHHESRGVCSHIRLCPSLPQSRIAHHPLLYPPGPSCRGQAPQCLETAMERTTPDVFTRSLAALKKSGAAGEALGPLACPALVTYGRCVARAHQTSRLRAAVPLSLNILNTI